MVDRLNKKMSALSSVLRKWWRLSDLKINKYSTPSDAGPKVQNTENRAHRRANLFRPLCELANELAGITRREPAQYIRAHA